MSQSRRRPATKSKKKAQDISYSELKTIPEQRLQQQQQQQLARLQATPAPRRLGSTIPSSNLLSQMTQMTDREFEDDEEMERVFISQEEERRFRALLELFRKGKINSNNAFEVPLNVISRQQMSTSNLQLWKVASQMLNVSTNIYQKRVQNVFQQTSKVNSSIVRNQQQQQQLQGKHPKPSNQQSALSTLIMKGLENLEKGMLKTIDVGQGTLEEPEKVNGCPDEQFAIDPLFQKTRAVFDSSTTKGLLLNSFEISRTFEIQLLSDQPCGVVPVLQKGVVGEGFMKALESIQPQSCEIFQIFTSTQDRLCRQFEELGVDRDEVDRHAIHKIEDQQVLRFGQQLSKLQQLQPQAHSQPIPQIPHSQKLQSQYSQFLSQQAPVTISDLNLLKTHYTTSPLKDFEEFSEREVFIGTGVSEILSSFQTPWDIPNPFSKKRRQVKPLKRKEEGRDKKRKKKGVDKELEIFLDEKVVLGRGVLKAVKRSGRGKTPSKFQAWQPDESLLINKVYDDNSVQINNLFLKPHSKPTQKPTHLDPQSTNQNLPIQSYPKQFTFQAEYQQPLIYQPLNNQPQPLQPQPQSRPLSNLHLNSLLITHPTNLTAEFITNSPQKKKPNQATISMKRYKTVLYKDIVEKAQKKLTEIKPIQTISVQTTFVALLHLANEKGLSFIGNQRGDDFQILKREKMESE